MHINSDMCRLCGKSVEGVIHLVSGCQVLAGNEYLDRHNNNALNVLKTTWVMEKRLLEKS